MNSNYKYNISINVVPVIKHNLDLDYIDLIIFDFIKDFANSNNCTKIQTNDGLYFWISHTSIMNQLPLLKITSKAGIIKRIDNLIDAGILEKSKQSQEFGKSLYRFGKNYDKMIFSDSEPKKLGANKSLEGCKQKFRGGTNESLEDNNNNNINNILITQVEPEGFDSIHFVIAKMFHSLFVKLRGENDTLKNVKTKSYVDTIRLILDVDKRSVTQLAALKLYLEDSKKEGSKLNPFWADTIFSVKAFREKSKNGVHRWDLICLELKKWQSIEGNYQRATKLADTINQKAKEYDRVQEGL